MISLTLVNGDTAFVDWTTVAYVLADFTDQANLCFVYLLSSDPNESPLHVAENISNVVNALHTASGTSQSPLSPFAFFLIPGPDDLNPVQPWFCNANAVSAVLPDYADPAFAYVITSDGRGPWHVLTDPASAAGVVGVALTPAASVSMLSGFFAVVADAQVNTPMSFVNTGVLSFIATRSGFITGASLATNVNLVGPGATLSVRVAINGVVDASGNMVTAGEGDGASGRWSSFGDPVPFEAGDTVWAVYSTSGLLNVPNMQVALQLSMQS